MNLRVIIVILFILGCSKDNSRNEKTAVLKNERYNGNSISYYSNGQIKSIEPYSDGMINGVVKMYDSLGNLRSEFQVSHNKRNGTYRGYYPDGSIYAEEQYVDDKLNSYGVEYYNDGKIHRKYLLYFDSLVYYKGYDTMGYVYDAFLPISVENIDKNKYEIELLHTELDSARIGVIIGHLDSRNHLTDTLQVFGSKDLKLELEQS
ncbi:hypothetical protein LVD15_22810 [Fulvivirga maritima]|uniref:toxin-antitoxin system YwqK family antitoxin n=1 Tax=Fulvivirga maritima TaxID=2904247 RepID=UPI001F407998|nr:hypothetical protein [Fulvivirga maritima]UII26105.1 hypothetical protein LVD15_22810 [Fulvivirga maritima]